MIKSPLRANILVFALSLTACANQKVWQKDGATQQDFYMDQGQCKAQGFSVASGNLVQAAIVFNSCMQGKGWYLVSESDSSAHAEAIPTTPRTDADTDANFNRILTTLH